MRIEASIWNSETCIGYEIFSSPEELHKFMEIVKQVDAKATYRIKRVGK